MKKAFLILLEWQTSEQLSASSKVVPPLEAKSAFDFVCTLSIHSLPPSGRLIQKEAFWKPLLLLFQSPWSKEPLNGKVWLLSPWLFALHPLLTFTPLSPPPHPLSLPAEVSLPTVANPEHRAGSNVQNCAESNFFQPQHHHMWPQNQGSRGESPAEFGLLPSQCRGVLIFSCLAWCPVSQQASQKASLNHLVWRSVVSDQHMDLLSSHHSHCLWYAVEQAPFTHGHSQRAKGALIFLVGLTCSWYWMEGS